MEPIITIHNDDDHKKAMEIISSLMSATSGDELARLDAQALEVEAYDAVRWPMERATVEEINEYLMFEHDGDQAKVNEILDQLNLVPK